MEITLNPNCTAEQIALVQRNLIKPTGIRGEQWPMLLTAFDRLGESIVKIDWETWTFRRCYREWVENVYSTKFLRELTQLSDPLDITNLQSQYRRKVIISLTEHGLVDDASDELRCLSAFCLYWWIAFAKGYAREVLIYQDLETSGVEFQAHDITVREEQLSSYDLTVLGLRGDIKTSTYFLHTSDSLLANCDFYITRLWFPDIRCYEDIVLMTESIWNLINGETQDCDFDNVTDVFPRPARVILFNTPMIVVSYSLWKEKVKRRQATQGGLNNE